MGYNLIRGLMAEAARAATIRPRQLSFRGAWREARSFEQAHLYDPARIAADAPRLLELIARKRIDDRPDRFDPRAVKRRPKPHPLPRMPRGEAKRLIAMGIHPYNKAWRRLCVRFDATHCDTGPTAILAPFAPDPFFPPRTQPDIGSRPLLPL